MSGGSRSRRAARRLARSTRRFFAAAARAGPRRSSGEIDYLPAEVPAGPLSVSGWAFDRHLRTLAVVVMLDDVAVEFTTTGLARPDVERARPRAKGSKPGFAVAVDLGGRESGDAIRIQALLVRDHGIVDELDPRSTRIEGPLVTTTTPAGEALSVRGTLKGQTPACWVEIRVNGVTAARARPWRETPNKRSEIHAVVEGFDVLIGIDALESNEGRYEVEAIALRMDGSHEHLGPVSVVTTGLREVVEASRPVAKQLPGLRRRAKGGPRRLLVVTHSLDIGGGQLYVDELLGGLLPDPDVSCLVISPTDGPLRKHLEDRGVQVAISGEFPREPEAYEALLAKIAARVRAHGADVALMNTLGSAIGADLSQRLRIPYYWAIHESVPPALYWCEAFGTSYEPEVRALGLDALSGAECLIFEADATLDLYRGAVPDERLLKVPYGIDFTSLDRYLAGASRTSLRADAGFADSDFVFVCVGTMEPRKLQTGLVLAFQTVARDFPEARLVLVGDVPGRLYSDAVHELIERSGLEASISVVPVTPDVFDWYLVADAIVSTSDLESMPRSLIEAMGFERVVLSTDVFGVRELIDDGRTGFLMEARNLRAIIDGFERVLALSPAQRHAIGRAAAQFVRAEHDAASYVAAYRELLLART